MTQRDGIFAMLVTAKKAAYAIDRLIGFAVHDDDCESIIERDCSCGLSDLLKEIGDDRD